MKVLSQLPPASELGFGKHFCPQMIVADYTQGAWGPARLCGAEDLKLHPAAKVLHYGQEVFEGLKAYKQGTRTVLFRPDANVRRMSRSAEIMAMPPYPEDRFLSDLKTLVKACADFVPAEAGALYLRPALIGVSAALGVSASKDYRFFILASPVGSYFGPAAKATGPSGVSILVTDQHARAVRGGTGSAKTGGNYAASLRALHKARSAGYDNVLFLDAIKRTDIEELAAMNFFCVENGVLRTPPLGDTILDGVTRDSLIHLAGAKGLKVSQEALPLQGLLDGLAKGSVTEVFACGTAAAVAAVTRLGWQGRNYTVADAAPGPLTCELYKTLTDIQYGRREAPAGWIVPV